MLNFYELILLVVAVLILLIYVRWRFRSWIYTLLVGILCLLPLYLSIERTTQFLTVDEPYIIDEAIEGQPPHTSYQFNVLQWERVKLRTTEALLSPVSRIAISRLFNATYVKREILLKALHWLSGFLVLMWIHYVVSKHFVAPEQRQVFTILYLFVALLLPTNNIALKVFNYDLLSMLLAVLAIFYIAVALKTNKSTYALIAVIIALLAAQEKLNASPILLFAIGVFGYMRSRIVEHRRYTVTLPLSLATAFLLAALTAAVTLLIVTGVQITRYGVSEVLPLFLARLPHIVDPLIVWAVPINLFVTGQVTGDLEAVQALNVPVFLAVSFLFTYVIGAALLLLDKWLRRPEPSWPRLLRRVNMVFIVLILTVAVIATFSLKVYLAPYYPIPAEAFHPPAKFAGAAFHFLAPTLFQHILAFISFAYAVFVYATPSVLWLFLIVAWAALWIWRRERPVDLPLEVILLLGLAMPMAYALFQIPTTNKYLNIPLFLVALILSVHITGFVASLSQVKQSLVSTAFWSLLVLEILPFGPLYAAFRPIWVNYDTTFSTEPTSGRIDTAWLGWGEEVMLTGQWMKQQCDMSGNNTFNDVPCRSLRLYTAYMGDVIDEETSITVIPFWRVKPGGDEFSYTAADYYVINRAVIVQDMVRFPAEVEPVHIISMRGYQQAWVFRGDDLKRAGFEFTSTR